MKATDIQPNTEYAVTAKGKTFTATVVSPRRLKALSSFRCAPFTVATWDGTLVECREPYRKDDRGASVLCRDTRTGLVVVVALSKIEKVEG